MKIKNENKKSFLVKTLQWFYLVLGIGTASSVFWYKQITVLSSLYLPNILIYSLAIALTFYCLILTVSFFTQNTNLLILALVLIFFTTIGALILLVIALPGAQAALSGHIPACAKNLQLCSLKDGMVVASAIILSVSIPTLVLNLITITGAVKAIAAGD